MRVLADNLTRADFYAAAAVAQQRGHDLHIDELTETGSRKRRKGFTVYCESFHGRRSTNRRGEGSTGRSASWTAYGWFIAELLRRDPKALVGHYESVEDFRKQCQQMHRYHQTEAPKRRGMNHPRAGDPGEDISFLELVEEVEA